MCLAPAPSMSAPDGSSRATGPLQAPLQALTKPVAASITRALFEAGRSISPDKLNCPDCGQTRAPKPPLRFGAVSCLSDAIVARAPEYCLIPVLGHADYGGSLALKPNERAYADRKPADP